MIPKKLIPSFFIFGLLILLYVFGMIEFSTPIIIGMLVFWICTILFDLHTTFQRRKLLQNESNPILSYLLEKTTIKNIVILYIGFQVMCIIFLPMIYFWQIDFVYSSLFAVLAGTIHLIAGISNQKLVEDFDSRDLIL